jgi:hypothetical protein
MNGEAGFFLQQLIQSSKQRAATGQNQSTVDQVR